MCFGKAVLSLPRIVARRPIGRCAVHQDRRWTPIRHAQEERLRELEGLTPFQAVKFALGQRIRKTRSRPQGTKEKA